MLCGGEPLVVPHFLALAEELGRAGVQLKIETNGQRFDAAVAERLARLPIRSVQISLDGDTEDDLRAPAGRRVAGGGARRLPRRARGGLPLEITFAPTRINLHEAGQVIERARSLGAFRFNTGRLMRIGTAARLWDRLEPSEAAVRRIPRLLERAVAPVRGRDGALLSSRSRSATACGRASRARRRPCSCCPTAGSRWRRRCRRSVPICATIALDDAWNAYRAAWRSDKVVAAARRVIEDEAMLADANGWQAPAARRIEIITEVP